MLKKEKTKCKKKNEKPKLLKLFKLVSLSVSFLVRGRYTAQGGARCWSTGLVPPQRGHSISQKRRRRRRTVFFRVKKTHSTIFVFYVL